MAFPIGFATGAGIPSTEEMDAAVAFGAKFIRCGIPWDAGSSAPDRNFDTPNGIRNAIAYANSVGLGIILQIGAGSTYGGMMYTHSGPAGFDVLTEFSKFCANVCRYFTGSPGDADYVWAVEIGNECNHSKWNDLASPYFVHWTGAAPTGPQRYAETFLRIVHPLLENVRATPGCPKIITTGLGGERDTKGINSYDFTVAIHQDVTFGATTYPGGLWSTTPGANPWYNGYDLHPYFYPETDPVADVDGGWLNMRQIMAWFQTNRGQKPPLWITEVGYPTNPETFATCIAARDAMQNMVDDLDLRIATQGWDIRSFAWFSMMNNNKPDTTQNDNYFGIVDRPVLGGTDPQNGPRKPGPPTVPSGAGQLFNKFVQLANRDNLPAKYGTATFGGGGTFTAFGTNNVVTVPDTPTYDKTGSADIYVAMQALIESLPNGTRLRMQPNATYRCERTLLFDGTRAGGFKNILFDGRGATIRCNVTKYFSSRLAPNGVVSGCVIGGQKWVFGPQTIKTITAPAGTAPFDEIVRTNFLSWYVEGTGKEQRTQGAKDMSSLHMPNVPGPTSTVIHIISDTVDTPPDGVYTLTFTSPSDRNRSNFQFDNCKDFLIKNLEVQGANTGFATFKNQLEAQTGLGFGTGCDGVEVKGCNVHHGWGDNITLQCGSGTPLKNIYIHDNTLHHATRQTIAIGGLIDSEITRNLMQDSKRHIIDMEPNGGNQTCQRIHFHDNDMQRGGLGIMSISAYGWLPMFIGDIRFANNRCLDNLSIPVGTNHDRPASQPRWGPFEFVNNTASQPFGSGSLGQGWTNSPGLFKFQYVDGITATGNVCYLQPGRLMYAVWAEKSTGIEVHDNYGQFYGQLIEPKPPAVKPDPVHYNLRTDNYAQGFATFRGGGRFDATGTSVVSIHGSAQFVGGGDFSAVGKGRNHATAVSFLGGGLFPATGAGKVYATAVTFLGGGDFSARGLGQNFGSGTFAGGGDFTATGVGRNFGTATFDGGNVFTAIGHQRIRATAVTFQGGGSFSAVGASQNFGRCTFNGGGTFTADGNTRSYGTATFDGGGTFTARGAGPNFGRGSFDGGGTFSAFGNSVDNSEYQDGEWLVGAVKLRGPGWDDRPWDSTPWDGEE